MKLFKLNSDILILQLALFIILLSIVFWFIMKKSIKIEDSKIKKRIIESVDYLFRICFSTLICMNINGKLIAMIIFSVFVFFISVLQYWRNRDYKEIAKISVIVYSFLGFFGNVLIYIVHNYLDKIQSLM